MKAIKIDETVTTCDCCGKTNLKSTVMLLRDDGETVHYGSRCAQRNSGKAAKAIAADIRTEYDRVRRDAARELRASAEYQAYEAKLRIRPLTLMHSEAVDFVRVERAALVPVRAAIAAKYGINVYEIAA